MTEKYSPDYGPTILAIVLIIFGLIAIWLTQGFESFVSAFFIALSGMIAGIALMEAE